LQDDKNGEYMSKNFEVFCIEHEIARCHYAQQSSANGVAERFNCTLAEKITIMLHEDSLPTQFCRETLAVLVYILNHIPTTSMHHSTLFEMWFKCKPDVSNPRICSCLFYVHVQKSRHGVLRSHMEKCIFLGYSPDLQGLKVLQPQTPSTL
jgi:hypothetical protein